MTSPDTGAGPSPAAAAEAAAAPLIRRGLPTDPRLRILAGSTLVNTAGNGAVLTTTALYFTRHIGLAATQVGFALSAAAVVALVSQVPLGHLGDTYGPRRLLVALRAVTGVVTLGLMITHSFAMLIVVLAVEAFFDRGAAAVRNGYIARVATGGRGVAFKAYLRACTNVGISAGALLGGAALWVDRPWAYLTAFAFNGVSCLGSAWVQRRLPELEVAPPREPGESRWLVLRDRPYVVVTVLTGIVAMHFFVIELGMPLWIATHSHAPKSLVAVTLLINTVAVALFQVRLSRGTDTVMAGARRMALSSVFVFAGFALIALAAGVTRWLAIVLVLAGAAVHVVGEMTGSAGQWGVQMGLAPPHRQGQYQGFAGTSFSLASIVTPPLVAALCIDWGRPGWFVLGGIVVVGAVLCVPASAWALRTRARYGVTGHTG